MERFFEYHQKVVRTIVKDGQIWFAAKDVCDILEIGDVSSALRRLDDDERGTDSIPTPSSMQEMLVVNESGLYTLVLGSRKAEAKAFRRWVTQEVLPQIRQTGQYAPSSVGVLPIQAHTKKEIQIQMSKNINGRQYSRGGKTACIKYNVKNCLSHTGKTPTAIKEEGKKKNLPSRITQSAKEVIRKLQPEKACSMSMADNLVEQGHNEDKVFPITIRAETIFKDLIKLGVMPAELRA